jgi:hypothetical protein
MENLDDLRTNTSDSGATHKGATAPSAYGITYGEIRRTALMERRRANLSGATVINAANAWRRYLNKSENDYVGADLGESFRALRDAFLLQLTPSTNNNIAKKREGLKMLRAAYFELAGFPPDSTSEGLTYADLLETIQLEKTTHNGRRTAIYLWLEHHDIRVQQPVGDELLDSTLFAANLDDVVELSRFRGGNHQAYAYGRRGNLKSVRVIALSLHAGKTPKEAIAAARREPHGSRQDAPQESPRPVRTPTYGQLRQDLSVGASARNRLAALNDWLQEHKLEETNPIGLELLEEARFETAVRHMVARIRNKDTANNKVSALRGIRDAAAARVPNLPKATLKEALREALKKIGISPRAAIKKYGTSLQSWLYRGHAPTKKESVEMLKRLATDAGEPADHFAKYVARTKTRDRKTGVNKWAKETRRRVTKPYAANRKATQPLPPRVQQWIDAYCDHKKRDNPAPLKRWKGKKKGHGQWKVTRGRCSAEGLFRQHADEFFGFLQLPSNGDDPDLRGMGIAPSELRFPMFAEKRLVKAFFEFKKARSRRGHYVKGDLSLHHLHTPLIHPVHGFVTQQPGALMPELGYLGNARPKRSKAFSNWCATQLKELIEFRDEMEIEAAMRMARDPKNLLSQILDQDQPLTYIRDLIRKMELDRPPANAAKILRARHEADIALIALWTSCPVRAFNMSIAEVNKQLHRRSDGWWFREERENFKNAVFLENRPYWEIRIAEPFQPYIDEYIDHWRKELPGCQAGSPYVWVNHSDKDPNRIEESSLAERMRTLTGTYTGTRLSCHWIRHVVATDYILNRPGSFIVAAYVLNDSLKTVFKSYAHLAVRAMNRHYPSYLQQIFPSQAKRAPRPRAPSEPSIFGSLPFA